jgi:hypothetical protein
LEHQADTIVFFDKSARSYGLLTNNILPVIALDKAIQDGVDPQEIKIPKIEFYRPPSRDEGKSRQEINGVELETFRERVRRGERILFFDESSSFGSLLQHIPLDKHGNDEGRWNRNTYPGFSPETGEEITSLGSVIYFVSRLAEFLSPEERERCLAAVGVSEQAGGHAQRVITGGTQKISDSIDLFNISDSDNKDSVRVARADIYGPEFEQQRQQVRAEFSRMAWELFREVILKENLVQPTEEIKRAKMQELVDWGIIAKLQSITEAATGLIESLSADGLNTSVYKKLWDTNKKLAETFIYFRYEVKQAQDILEKISRGYINQSRIFNDVWDLSSYFKRALNDKEYDDVLNDKRRATIMTIISISQEVIDIFKQHNIR